MNTNKKHYRPIYIYIYRDLCVQNKTIIVMIRKIILIRRTPKGTLIERTTHRKAHAVIADGVEIHCS